MPREVTVDVFFPITSVSSDVLDEIITAVCNSERLIHMIPLWVFAKWTLQKMPALLFPQNASWPTFNSGTSARHKYHNPSCYVICSQIRKYASMSFSVYGVWTADRGAYIKLWTAYEILKKIIMVFDILMTGNGEFALVFVKLKWFGYLYGGWMFNESFLAGLPFPSRQSFRVIALWNFPINR